MLRFFHREKNASPFMSVGSMNLFTEIWRFFLQKLVLIEIRGKTHGELDVHIVHDPVVVEAEVEIRLLVEVAHTLNIHHLPNRIL